MSGPAVEVRGLTRRFGGITAVDGVDLSVASGEIFGLIGCDGAGKTTLMRMLAAILPPDSGRASVAGCDVVRQPEQLKQRIGYLSQAFSLYSELTIEENLDFVADLFLTPRAEARRLKREMLDLTGLAPFAARQAGRLSGGMKQKLALSCALIHRPQVLLLDEPTTGVDPVSRRDFWRILGGLPEQGVTVLLTSPYMDEASRCHRLALMDNGRILATGSTAELCGNVPGAMLEVVTPQARRAAQAVVGLPGVLSATPFGDSLHVRVGEESGQSAVEEALRAAEVPFSGVSTVSVSLEDAFVHYVHLGAAA
ncbi:MAG: ABC transporter ATP-binding protein [Armatimonadetes bacterium]|nr:ABC transporter ATP-binding protein [Armatimonadota bacterium]